jgi:hypothetical protein
MKLIYLLLVAPLMSFAAQFVLFDVTFTFTKMDADNSTPSKSHYYVREPALNPDRPKDWTSPADYRNGTVHIRAEVMEKPPGGENTTWTLCYIPNQGQGNGYGCTGTVMYKEKGVYEQDVSMTSWWQNDAIVWTAGIKRMDLVSKDGSGGGGHAHKRTDPEKFFPTKMRITMVQVSVGSTYDASVVPGLRAKNTLVEKYFFSKASCASDMGSKRNPCSTEMLNPMVSSSVPLTFAIGPRAALPLEGIAMCRVNPHNQPYKQRLPPSQTAAPL